MTTDILWAMTRLDEVWRDRTVYEAFAIYEFDDGRHQARRRRTGPADYTRLDVALRHAMLAAAVVVASETEFHPQAYPPRAPGRSDLAILLARLAAADADALHARSGRWPEASRRRSHHASSGPEG